MGKHLSFWIGFFAAALLVVPVALGIMGVAEERLRQMAVVLFAGVSVLVVLLVVALFFRDAILRRVLGRSEVALEDVAGSLVSAVAAATVPPVARSPAQRHPAQPPTATMRRPFKKVRTMSMIVKSLCSRENVLRVFSIASLA